MESRGYACLCLKQEIKQARGLAVASGLVPATSLPGCSAMVQPNRLPVKYAEWALSWTDTPYKDRKTKLIRWVCNDIIIDHDDAEQCVIASIWIASSSRKLGFSAHLPAV